MTDKELLCPCNNFESGSRDDLEQILVLLLNIFVLFNNLQNKINKSTNLNRGRLYNFNRSK